MELSLASCRVPDFERCAVAIVGMRSNMNICHISKALYRGIQLGVHAILVKILSARPSMC